MEVEVGRAADLEEVAAAAAAADGEEKEEELFVLTFLALFLGGSSLRLVDGSS